MKIAVGMSGGVDSSVAALLLKEQGHEVIGLSMSLWDGADSPSSHRRNACYGPDEKMDIAEAEQICRILGIPFQVIDCSGQYREKVLTYFREEYLSARTPNPCVVCNHKIKFGTLLSKARSAGMEFDIFATGHYAIVEYDADTGRYLLKKGRDSKKDQSYFLYMLSQAQLQKALFPLGTMTKDEVRNIAKGAGLPVSAKEESQDFYEGNYRDLLDVNDTEGDIVHVDGRVLGRHKGIWNYTPGQRRGLSVSNPEPLYVVKLDGRYNRVIVGTKDDTLVSSFTVRDVNWIAIHKISRKFTAAVKTRYAQTEMQSDIDMTNPFNVRVTPYEKIESVSPGQSAVFYDGDVIIGGGIIEKVS
ncbi:MAG TPA: tRNA 2-thiouridine(34) synthase MnmA [Spirochaetota bacterium]|nr:tRNA 2-thiouridine(34) synthase MnmA [Spirochaetota bacterium]